MNIKDITGPGTTFNVQTMNVIVVGDEKQKEKLVNPGVEYGDDGKAKWSPPLQQHIDIAKDVAGETTDDTTVEPTEEEQSDELDIDRIKQLASIFAPNEQMPAR